jgi:hypothetical protein
MKKDIKFHPVTGVKMAIVKEKNETVDSWSVYLINNNLIALETLMITTKGYGEIGGESKKTSVLRHKIEKLEATSIARVEAIDPALFSLNNEFWVSYYILDQIFDKKFIFVAGSVQDKHMTHIPELDMQGILHP